MTKVLVLLGESGLVSPSIPSLLEAPCRWREYEVVVGSGSGCGSAPRISPRSWCGYSSWTEPVALPVGFALVRNGTDAASRLAARQSRPVRAGPTSRTGKRGRPRRTAARPETLAVAAGFTPTTVHRYGATVHRRSTPPASSACGTASWVANRCRSYWSATTPAPGTGQHRPGRHRQPTVIQSTMEPSDRLMLIGRIRPITLLHR